MPKQSQGPRLVRRKNKPNWFIRYIDEAVGKQKDVSTGCQDREDAEEVLEEFLRQRRAKRLGLAVQAHQVTVAQILDDYAHFKMGASSAERLSYSMEHLLGFWGDQTLDHVNVETISLYRKQGKGKGRAQATIRRELIDLRSAVNHAVNMTRVAPFKFPKLPKDSPPKKRWVNENEFAKLLRAAGHDYRSKFTLRLFLIIAFYSGARKGAIMELEWSQVDFQNNTIDFNKTDFSHLDSNSDDEEKPQKPRAFIPMAPEIRRVLMRRHERYGHLTNFVFHQRHDPSQRVRSIDKGFRSAAKLAGLSGVTPHTLRHTRVSLLLQSGEKTINISNYMNLSQQTIDEVYGHHSNSDVEEMAMRLGRTQKVRTTKLKRQENREN